MMTSDTPRATPGRSKPGIIGRNRLRAERRDVSEGSYIVRLGDIETDIIEAVRSQDAVGGLKAFMRYRGAIEAEVREDVARQVAALPVGTICQCGAAKEYHRPEDHREHEYEPRYPAGSVDRAAVLALLADPLKGGSA